MTKQPTGPRIQTSYTTTGTAKYAVLDSAGKTVCRPRTQDGAVKALAKIIASEVGAS